MLLAIGEYQLSNDILCYLDLDSTVGNPLFKKNTL
jgi:hypothetical protein